MSDALLTRIAETLEALLAHVKSDVQKVEAKVSGKKAPKADSAPAAAVPAAQPSAAAPAATAPTPAAVSPGAPDLMTQTANAVIDLANNYSRDAAVEEMAKFGAQKVSQVKPGDLAALLNNATVRIAAEKAKKSNESLV
jgi:hypothetical protein